MSKQVVRYTLIFWLLATASVAFQRELPSIDTGLLQKGIDHGFPGFVLASKKGEEPVEIRALGFADLENKIQITANARFHIASITKIFTATAALMLVDDGKLNLNANVTDILDRSLLNKIPHIDKITVGQLLDHSSGIYGFNNDKDYIDVWLGPKYQANKIWTAKELISFSDGSRVKPFGKPGTGHFYGDTNYVLLRLIIEKKTGMSLRQFVRRRILEPLSLTDTGYYGETVDKDLVSMTTTVQGYLKRSEELDFAVKLHESFQPFDKSLVNTTSAVERLDGPSGMVSTAGDLATFGRALYSGRLLKKESMDWLLSIGKGLENERPGTSRQGVIKFYREPYGVLYASTGDGPAGINVTLAYHPKSDTVFVGFTNIFGLFDEADFMREQIFSTLAAEVP